MNLKWNTNMNNSFYSVIKIDERFKKIVNAYEYLLKYKNIT